MRACAHLAVAMIALGAFARPAAAQQVETPVAFDSAGRVRTITPQLVERYGLSAPAWPVTGAFVEARLYAVSTGGEVLVVERPNGAVERYPLSETDARALRDAVDAGRTRPGATPTETRAITTSSPAGNAFARNQMLLSLFVYGPLLASLADDGQTGTALYLLGAGSAFFISLGISKDLEVTRAQNLLATDGAVRGYLATAAAIALVDPGVGRKTYSVLGLAGALGGSALGYQRAKPMMAGHALANPPRAGEAVTAPARTGARLRLDPTALALAASRAPGTHALLSLTF